MEYVSENKSHVASGCMLSDWVIVGPRNTEGGKENKATEIFPEKHEKILGVLCAWYVKFSKLIYQFSSLSWFPAIRQEERKQELKH